MLIFDHHSMVVNVKRSLGHAQNIAIFIGRMTSLECQATMSKFGALGQYVHQPFAIVNLLQGASLDAHQI